MKTSIVKTIRTGLGMNLLQFSKVAGFSSKQHVWSIENKDKSISLFLLDRMVRHLSSNGFDIAIDTDIYITFQGVKIKL